jgi:hypothetical protein
VRAILRAEALLDDYADLVRAQPARQDGGTVDAAEQRTFGNSSCRQRAEPSVERRDGLELAAEWHSFRDADALLVGLGSPDDHHDALGMTGDVGNVQADQLGAAKSCSKSQQDERTIAQSLEVLRDLPDGGPPLLVPYPGALWPPPRIANNRPRIRAKFTA